MTALTNVRRYNTLKSAQAAALRQVYWTPVLMGDDGLFWVPATNREASQLIRAGYEAA